MYFSRTAAIVLRQFYLMRGSLARVLPLFVWVAVDIVLWGFITRYLNTVARSGFNFVPVLLGAVLLWDFFTRVMHGVTLTFMEDVWSRNFLNIFASPLSMTEYVSGLVLSSTASSMVGLAVMLLLATTVFGLPFFGYRSSAPGRTSSATALPSFHSFSCCFCSESRWASSVAVWCCGSDRRQNGSSGPFRPWSRHSPECFTRSRVGGGERMGHFGGPEWAKPPRVDGDENVASPAKLIKFSPQ